MIIYTDSIEYAGQVLQPGTNWQAIDPAAVNKDVRSLSGELFDAVDLAVAEIDGRSLWRYLFLVKTSRQSQYDVLIDQARRKEPLPSGILCLAGSGSRLHGFKNRPWVALPGNVHLSVFLAPQQKVDHFAVGFTILSAVSVLEVIDSIRGLKEKGAFKWVNDILIENCKVAGVLAHTQSQGEVVTGAVLGIGINVESTPKVDRDPFVPRVASLCDFVANSNDCNQRLVFERLIDRLAENYRLLLDGQYRRLLDCYRERSVIIGREVSIYADDSDGYSGELAHGKVVSIGENLELYLQGVDKPIFHGRMVLK